MFSFKSLAASAAIAVASFGATSGASAATYDGCANFSLSLSGGSVTNLGSSTDYNCEFTLIGSDSGGFSTVTTYFTATTDDWAPGYTVEGLWNYSTADIGGSSWDTFGYVIGQTLYQLSTDALLKPGFHNGGFSFWVGANTTFGWYIQAKDNQLGAATVDIFGNIAAVPLPAGGLLLLSALGGLGLVRRRREKVALA